MDKLDRTEWVELCSSALAVLMAEQDGDLTAEVANRLWWSANRLTPYLAARSMVVLLEKEGRDLQQALAQMQANGAGP